MPYHLVKFQEPETRQSRDTRQTILRLLPLLHGLLRSSAENGRKCLAWYFDGGGFFWAGETVDRLGGGGCCRKAQLVLAWVTCVSRVLMRISVLGEGHLQPGCLRGVLEE